MFLLNLLSILFFLLYLEQAHILECFEHLLAFHLLTALINNLLSIFYRHVAHISQTALPPAILILLIFIFDRVDDWLTSATHTLQKGERLRRHFPLNLLLHQIIISSCQICCRKWKSFMWLGSPVWGPCHPIQNPSSLCSTVFASEGRWNLRCQNCRYRRFLVT